tara:strand:- start:7284 stop:7646 length:363 start_codon:yes stop_codon:yes gene_type:complete
MNPKLSLTADSAVRLIYDEDAILQSLKNIFATVQNERVRNPIGSRIIRLLFQPVSKITATVLLNELREVINKYEPRVIVDNINVIANEDQQYYDIRVNVKIRSIERGTSLSTRIRSFSSI